MTKSNRVVLVTSPGFDSTDPSTAGRLEASGLRIRHEPLDSDRSEAELVRLLDGAVAAIVSTDRMTRAVLSRANGLRVIARTGVGTDSIDLDAARDLSIRVVTTPDENAVTCAEHTIGLMLAATRAISGHDAAMKGGRWERPGRFRLTELSGSRVGVVGFGRIGRAVVRRLHAFDCEVRVCDPMGSDPGLDYYSLDDLLGWADVVTLHVPLDESTKHLIGADAIRLMSSTAVLVNTSRGGIIDERALHDALASGALGGAALDVFESEPPTQRELIALANVVATPHIGGLSVQSMHRMISVCVDGVLEIIQGELAATGEDEPS